MWSNGVMDGDGHWYLNPDDDQPIQTKQYLDMRRQTSGQWPPPDSVLHPNGTTTGCLQIMPSGLLNPRIDTQCKIAKKQACSYKGTMCNN